MKTILSVEDLTVKYGDAVIVKDISFDVEAGSWLMIVGPNGAGKSTIVRAISQSVPYKGQVLIDGYDAGKMKSRELARWMGVLSQDHYVGYGFTAEEVIRLGGYRRRGRNFFRKDMAAAFAHTEHVSEITRSEEELFNETVLLTGLKPYLKQSVMKLSGGELQRTFLAQLIMQDPEILVLDEPTNHLDLVYQKQIMEMIDAWRKEKARTIISVVHDLSLAKMFGTDALVIDKGKMVKYGTSDEVLTGECLDPVYSMDVLSWLRAMQEVWIK